MSIAAAVFASIAVVLARPSGGWLARERLLVPRHWSLHIGSLTAPLGVAGCDGVLMIGWPPAGLIVALTLGSVGVFVLRQMQSERSRRRAGARRVAVAEAVGLMAAELRAGVLPQRVLAGLSPDFPFLAAASRAADLGGDVAAALRSDAVAPCHELLGELSSAWMVSERAGAPLAHVLDRLEASARDDREIEREVQSGVAPARATGRLMAVLPAVGLMLGTGMGSDPVDLLTSTVPGALCLAAGSAFACAGVAWVNRIAAAAERVR